MQGKAGGYDREHHRANIPEDLPEDECAWEDEDDGSTNVEPGFEFGLQAEEGEDAYVLDDCYDYYCVPEDGMLDECGYWLTSSQASLGQADASLYHEDE